MYGQFPNIPTWKEERTHDVGIGGKGQALTCSIQAEGCCIIHSIEQRIGECGREDAFNQVVGRLAAASMTERNLFVAQIEFMTACLPCAFDLFSVRRRCGRYCLCWCIHTKKSRNVTATFCSW